MTETTRRFLANTCFSTDQPHHHSLVAHVGGSMQAGHAILGPQMDISSAFIHEVLDNMQVPLLAGEVERGGTDDRLVVHTPELQQRCRR